MEINRIIQGDAFEEISKLPDRSVNLILTDIPYGETGNEWDKKIDLKKLMSEFERIIVNEGCIAMTATMKLAVKLINVAEHIYKYDWIWEKDNGTNVVAANHQPLRVHEFVLIFGKQAVTYTPRSLYMKYYPQKTEGKPYKQTSGKQSSNWKGGRVEGFETNNEDGTRHPRTIQKFIRDKDKLHPTQKPIALFEYLIKTYTDKNDLVFDPFMGSGTTAVACRNLGRNYLGVELDPGYVELANKRLMQENLI